MPPADGSQAAKIARPALSIHRDAESHVVIIDASQEAGREALERWSYIDPVEREKWAKPWQPPTFAEIDAAGARLKAKWGRS